MLVPVPQELINFIHNGKKFVVLGHEEPDGDCVGSQLAICSLLKRLGKEAFPCSAGPFNRNEVKSYERYFYPWPECREELRVLIMDCSNRERIGDFPIEGLPVAAVDHHSGGNLWGEVLYLNPQASSVAFMTEMIFTALGEKPTTEEAELLLFGLCTDTGFFRHLTETGAETFNTAARLTAAGASPKKTFVSINGGRVLKSRLLMGNILAKTRSYFDGRLLLSDETIEDAEKFGMESRDSDMIYQLLQSVEGVEAMALIRQENSEECTMGLRSRDKIDVAAIAKSFGGGGHKNAAGAKVRGTVADLEKELTAAFAPWFA
ncbi:MAG: bifunctional oligoribonuclease/PAP phosphatase NrnA [Treponema sp.]|jgi:phosphoesterase RecJ-like protein|nr:bifunctional oligoribonuclease/PAP phosphatase NrnA [Treponema sp.]